MTRARRASERPRGGRARFWTPHRPSVTIVVWICYPWPSRDPALRGSAVLLREPLGDLDDVTAPRFPHLFSPIRLGPREARNRIVSTPHTTGFGVGGFPRERWLAYEREKARGGAGTIMMFGSASVHPSSPVACGRRHRVLGSRDRAAPPGDGRCRPRVRRSLPRPGVPLGPRRRRPLRGRAPPGPFGRARRDAPRDPADAHQGRDSHARRRLRPGRAPREGGGLRRRRPLVLGRPPHRAVPLARQQPADRRVRRLAGEPPPLLPRDARGGAGGRGARPHRRRPADRRPDGAGGTDPRGHAGHRDPPRRHRLARLRDGERGVHRALPGSPVRDADLLRAARPLQPLRRGGESGGADPGHRGGPRGASGAGRGSAGAGLGGRRGDDARPHRGSRDAGEGRRRPDRGDPRLHGRERGLYRPAHPGEDDRVHPEPRDRPRGGARPDPPRFALPARGGGGRRSRRSGGRPDGRAPGPSRHPVRGRGRARGPAPGALAGAGAGELPGGRPLAGRRGPAGGSGHPAPDRRDAGEPARRGCRRGRGRHRRAAADARRPRGRRRPRRVGGGRAPRPDGAGPARSRRRLPGPHARAGRGGVSRRPRPRGRGGHPLLQRGRGRRPALEDERLHALLPEGHRDDAPLASSRRSAPAGSGSPTR